MRYGLCTLIILVLAALTTPAFAQQNIFTNYTSRDGLVSNLIRRIFQDSKGFLWFITNEGISKYDGHKFSNYNTHNGLSHSFVNDFYEAKDGKIYVACNDGSIDMIIDNKVISKVVTEKIIVNRFNNSPDGKIIATTDYNGIMEFRDGKLMKPTQSFPWRRYYDLIWLNDSLFMVVSDSSLEVFNRKYELFTSMNDQSTVLQERIIYTDSHKRIWLCSHQGLKQIAQPIRKNSPLQFVPLPREFDIPLLRQNWISNIYEDKDGIFWIGTNEGMVKINPDGSNQVFKKIDGFISDFVNCIFQDREKNIWFGSHLGISKLVTQLNIRMFGTAQGLLSNQIYFIHPLKKEYVMIGTAKGLQLFNTGNKKFTLVRNTEKKFIKEVVPNTQSTQLFSWKEIISFDTTVLEVNEKKSSLFKDNYFENLTRDKSGHFFWGRPDEVLFFSAKHGPSEKVLNLRPTGLVIDKKGYLWVGTWENGLYRIRYQVNGYKLNILSKEHYMPGDRIRSLFEDSKGNIWVGTRYNGVYRFKNDVPDTSFEEKVFSDLHFDQSKGLMSNIISSIAETNQGNIWLRTGQGLEKLVKQDTGYRVFNFSTVYNFFTYSVSMGFDKDNTMWLATIDDGIVGIEAEEMESLKPLPVYITNIISKDSVYSASSNKLKLNYRNNQLHLEFSSPGFINEKQLLYSYRLLGSGDDEWSKPSNEHSVSYASLQPGYYTFEVRNLGWNNEWGSTATFNFTISPPFWQTTWFRVGVILLLVVGCWLLVRRRIKSIRHEADLKHKIAETEMMALRAQMNPHFIFNSINSIENLIQTDQKEQATTYLAKFAKLIRAILENSKQELIPCWKDMEVLQLYLELEKLRRDKTIISEIKVDERLKQGDYKVPPMLLQPYVENAIQHGLLNKISDNRRLLVEAMLENDHIKYIVEDNGVGREKAKEYERINRPTHQSMGMQITEQRIQLHNKIKTGSVKITDLYDDNNKAAGTRVELLIDNPV